MSSHSFFAYVFRMRYIARWALMRNTRTENVEEHSYEVAVLAHALAVIGREVFHRDVSPERTATAALFHDAPEIITGDLPTPIKYYNPELKNAYKGVETVAQEKLLEKLPENLRGAYAPLLREEDETLSRYVKAADKLAAWLKCQEELKAGNREFSRAADETMAALRAMELPEADWFLNHFGEAFTLTLDDLG
jgi:5'-deoxynucleotidase